MKKFYGLLFIVLLNSATLYANEFGVTINHADSELIDNSYIINAQIDFQLSNTAKQALQSSIPLSWNIQIKLKKPRDYLWDETLLEKNIPIKIRYHSLLNLYQLHLGTAEVENYNHLSSALYYLGKMTAIKLIHNPELSTASNNELSIRVYFDKEALPLPLRPQAYVSKDWSLSSETYSWRVIK